CAYIVFQSSTQIDPVRFSRATSSAVYFSGGKKGNPKAVQLKIYISSTFIDLEQYRERVYKYLRSLGHDVIAMEDYVATDTRPLEKCLKDVRDAHVYVGIFAWRYGYIPIENNPEKKLITELELDEAKRVSKP